MGTFGLNGSVGISEPPWYGSAGRRNVNAEMHMTKTQVGTAPCTWSASCSTL